MNERPCSPPAAAQAMPAPGEAGTAGMLGMLGGGQLGRMFVHAAQAQGWRVLVLEPDAFSPAAAAADAHLALAYEDELALAAMQQQCVAVSTEFENVPARALAQLQQAGLLVAPPAAAVQVCQHRWREKQCFVSAGVPCAPHALIEQPEHLGQPDVAALLPGILKTATLGYDGKGQARVATLAELAAAWDQLGRAPCVLEKMLPLRTEISVILARARDGQMVHLPVQQNLHRDGVLAVTQVPAPDLTPATAQQAVACAQQLAVALDYVGVLCVEFFVLSDGSLVANEMAPRPHNSGHYSIDACDISQFDLQLRTLVGWPLVQPRQHSPAMMLNLLGDLWFDAANPARGPRTPDWAALQTLPGVHLHLYGKAEPRRGRKMGHLTLTGASVAEVRSVALQACALLGLPPV